MRKSFAIGRCEKLANLAPEWYFMHQRWNDETEEADE